MVHRRQLLSASAAALGPLSACASASGRTEGMASGAAGVPDAIGIQLWTVRDRLPADFESMASLLHADVENDLFAQDDTTDRLRTARRSLAYLNSLHS